MDRIGIDVIGPLPRSRKNNKYILVVGDYFTRWMEAFPIPHQRAEKVAEKIVKEFVTRFGTPLEIHSDQGSNFESDLFKEVCKLLQVTKTRTTPYHPSSNGLIERFNQTLQKMIRSYVDNNPKEWDTYIEILMAAYRSTIHPATGFSPNMMMMGREVNIPINIIYPLPKEESPQNGIEYVANLREKMEEMYKIARENLGKAANRQKIDYDSRIWENSYSIGSLVYKLKPYHRKFEPPWSGPYVVVAIKSPSVYKIQHKNKMEVVHHDRLKPCYIPDLPKWVKNLKLDD